jgi:DMSO/TMAO reductase YedYZ molybdopterin-dependent catalytic subunit
VKRVAAKPTIAIDGPTIRLSIEPHHLGRPITGTEELFVLAHAAIPKIDADAWSLDIAGLVKRPLTFSFEDLARFPQRTVASVHQCAGNPFEPAVAARQIANLVWRGVDLRDLLNAAGVDERATHLWAYGLEYGDFFGHVVTHYLKDVPLSRIQEGDVLIAHTLNDAPLAMEHGYPARLVVPGFYGTNCVKWLCRLELADHRPEGLFTTELYNDPVEGGGTKPVWAIEPESMFAFPLPGAVLAVAPQRIWGRAWSSADIVLVEVSFDGGESWEAAEITPREQYAWQTFSIDWQPSHPGEYGIQCRATDAAGRTQPPTGARNAIYQVDVVVRSA